MTSQRPDTGIRHRLPRGGNTCDFCGCSQVVKLYACHNFKCGERRVFAKDAGHWASCYVCSRLIERKSWRELVNRVMKEVRKRSGIQRLELLVIRKQLTACYQALEEHLIDGLVLTVHAPLVRVFQL